MSSPIELPVHTIQHQSKVEICCFDIILIVCNAKVHGLDAKTVLKKTPGICFLLCVEMQHVEIF